MEYKGIEYPVAFVEVDGKVVIIATESLERVLMPDGANYADYEARWVDERIFCYVPDEMIGRNDLEEYVNKEYL